MVSSVPAVVKAPLTFAATIMVQRRVIGALLMRELHTRFGRENFGYLWLFLEPGILATAITVIHEAVNFPLPIQGSPVFAYFSVGYVPYYMLRSIINRSTDAIHSNQTLFYHRQVRPLDVMISRCLLDVAACIFVVATACFVAFIVGEGSPEDPILILVGILLMAWYCSALSFIASAFSIWSSLTERLVHPMVYLYIPISGAFSMVAWTPTFSSFLLLIPSVNCFEMIRQGQFGSLVRAEWDIWYVLEFNAVATLIGLSLLRIAQRDIEL